MHRLAVLLKLVLLVALALFACGRGDEKPTGPVVRYPEKERQILLDGCVEDATRRIARRGLWATEESIQDACECVIRWHEENVPFEDYLVHAEKLEKGEMNKMTLWAMNAGEACLSE